jgi:glycosyltransferase involved in cell wall biosynthesis
MNLFKKNIRKAKLEKEIRFLGFKSQKDVAQLIKTSVALLLPSKTEGFGRVIIEAFACSRPVIGSNVGGIPELIESEKNGLLMEPGNSEDLADKLVFSLENPERMKNMGERGRTRVEHNFSIKEYCDNQFRMIESVLQK